MPERAIEEETNDVVFSLADPRTRKMTPFNDTRRISRRYRTFKPSHDIDDVAPGLSPFLRRLSKSIGRMSGPLPAAGGVDIVLNWFSELQQRVAVKSDLLHVDHESSTLHRGGGP